MAEPELEVAEAEPGDFAFRRVGSVCITPEADVLDSSAPAPGNAQHVAASSVYGIVFFADPKGAQRTRVADRRGGQVGLRLACTY
jgi:hypothetical protein